MNKSTLLLCSTLCNMTHVKYKYRPCDCDATAGFYDSLYSKTVCAQIFISPAAGSPGSVWDIASASFPIVHSLSCVMFSITVAFFIFLASALAFHKVIVPATFDEWEREGVPSWANNTEALRKHGLSVFRYQKLNPSAPHYFGYNRGTETGVYLKYIVDFYDNFPDVAVFVHAHPQGHQHKWLEMVQCISPNATYYNLNYGQSKWTTRNAGYWKGYAITIEQCWRDVLQVLMELKGKDDEFHARVPASTQLMASATCCNQFILSRDMVHRRPLHVWSELLNMIAIQDTCHIGEPDYENLHFFNLTGRNKVGPEKPINPPIENRSNGYLIPGTTGEHLSHVIFGHEPFDMAYPTMREYCLNFIKGCPGSPCQ